jgi:hypothetical protein
MSAVGEMVAHEVGETIWFRATPFPEDGMSDELFGADETEMTSDDSEESWVWAGAHDEGADKHEMMTKVLNAGWTPYLRLRMEQYRGCIVIRGFECEYPKESGEKWFAHFVKSGRYAGKFRWMKHEPAEDFGPKIKVGSSTTPQMCTCLELIVYCLLVV